MKIPTCAPITSSSPTSPAPAWRSLRMHPSSCAPALETYKERRPAVHPSQVPYLFILTTSRAITPTAVTAMFSSTSFQLTLAMRSVGHDVHQSESTRTAACSGMKASRTLICYLTNVFFSTEQLSTTTSTETSTPACPCYAEGLPSVDKKPVDGHHQAEPELKACLTSLADPEVAPAAALPTGETEAYIDQLTLNEEQARLQEAWIDFAPTPAAHISSVDSLAHNELLAIQEETTGVDTQLVEFAAERKSPAPTLPLSQADLMLDNPVPILADYGMDAHGPIDGKVVLKGANALRVAYEACRAETCYVKTFDATVDDGELAFGDALPTPRAAKRNQLGSLILLALE